MKTLISTRTASLQLSIR